MDQVNQRYGRGILKLASAGPPGAQALGDAAREDVDGVHNGLGRLGGHFVK
jgi:hypothetical protein